MRKTSYNCTKFDVKVSPYSRYRVTVMAFDTHKDWDVWDRITGVDSEITSVGAIAACYQWDVVTEIDGKKNFQLIAVCKDSPTLAEDIMHEVVHAATNHLNIVLHERVDCIAQDEKRAEITSYICIQISDKLGLTGNRK